MRQIGERRKGDVGGTAASEEVEEERGLRDKANP